MTVSLNSDGLTHVEFAVRQSLYRSLQLVIDRLQNVIWSTKSATDVCGGLWRDVSNHDCLHG